MMSTMQLRSSCGHCGKVVAYAADMAGKRVLCPKCKRDFRLPILEMPMKREETPVLFPPIMETELPIISPFVRQSIFHELT